ncbi:MAG TPA: GIY-YIG nuclease family protein [Chloroflexota bacterium]
MTNHLDVLRSEARQLPEAPGIYFWYDGDGQVLYIGKAVNLRSRVSSYFSNAHRDRRTRELLSYARSIRYEVTSTELEALFRESASIKREQPPFNRALRTSRRPYYLKFDGSRQDPYMEVARSTADPDSQYFGPFRTGRVIRETMAFLHDMLPLRKCTAEAPRCRPCIYYQMHKCAAPALDDVHREKHREAILQLFDLLDGRVDRVTAWLERKRDRLSESLLFERAAEVQERLDRLRELDSQHAILEAAIQCRCVLVQQSDNVTNEVRLLLVAHGHVLSVRDGNGADTDAVARWILAHSAVIKSVERQQSEIDAASVLERWIVVNRRSVRWVAIPDVASDDDLLDRVSYVLGSAARPATRLVHA